MLRPFLLLACSSILFGQPDVPTANYDNNRTNANLSEFILDTSNVNPTQFGKLYTFPVDGEVYAQPLYMHGIKVPGKGIVDVLFVATMRNTVYAFDADAKNGTAPLWSKNLGPSVNPHDFDLPPNPKSLPQGYAYKDILNDIGILGTPVIDARTKTLYAVHFTFTGSGDTRTHAYYLHALDLTNGNEKFNGPVAIEATVDGKGWGGLDKAPDNKLAFNAGMHLQRPGLLLVNGVVYVAFGSIGDLGPWHGWLLGFNAGTLEQVSVFNTTPNGAAAAIWQGGRGLAADSAGDIYCATGNGDWNGSKAWGQSVLRLSTAGAIQVADYFTPDKWSPRNANDTDVGSSGPVLIPGTNLLYSIGKDGDLFLLDRTNLGQRSTMDLQVVQGFEAAEPGISEAQEENGSFIFNTAFWDRTDGPLLYMWPPPTQPVPLLLHSYRMTNGTFETAPFSMNATAQSADAHIGMTVSANGSLGSTGILWATSAATRQQPAAGTLCPFGKAA